MSSGRTTASPPSATAGSSGPGSGAAELDLHPVAGGEDLGTPAAGDEVLRVAQDRVEVVVAVGRAVVEEGESSRARLASDMDGVLDRAVPPRPLLLVLGAGVLRVVDEQVDAVADLEHVGRHVVVGV